IHIILAAVLGFLLCQTWLAFGQVAVLKASADDPKTPLIVLSNPISQSMIGEAIKSEQDAESTLIPDVETTKPPATEAIATTEKVIRKNPVPPNRKPFLNPGQKQAPQLQDLLSLPGIWESSPIVSNGPLATTPTAHLSPVQPMFYPMPVYIPYPIPFMLNQPVQLMSTPPKDNIEDKIATSFNEMMTGNLLRSSLQTDDCSEWHKIIRNRIKPADQDGPKKWRGKWRKTTTTTTTTKMTTKAPQPTKPTVPVRLSESSDNEVKPIESHASTEATN
ncbi:hypothetical protein KR059_011563, partial [Drosophila kikkawai]